MNVSLNSIMTLLGISPTNNIEDNIKAIKEKIELLVNENEKLKTIVDNLTLINQQNGQNQ